MSRQHQGRRAKAPPHRPMVRSTPGQAARVKRANQRSTRTRLANAKLDKLWADLDAAEAEAGE